MPWPRALRWTRFLFTLEFLLVCSLLALVVELQWPSLVAWWNRPQPGKQTAQLFQETSEDGTPQASMGYWIYLPDDYANVAKRPWPLLIYLHGAGGAGDDLNLVARGGIPALIDQRKFRLPMIVVSPQCPANTGWQTEPALSLIRYVMENYPVDRDRVYLTGYSMGGFGTWALAVASPETFAAAMPIAGGWEAQQAAKLKQLPIWAFHGALDDVVPLDGEKTMVEAVEAAGGKITFTIFPDRGHDVCTDVYRDPKVIAWLLQQKRPPIDRAEPSVH